MIVSLSNATKAKSPKQCLFAMLDSNASNANSRNDQCTTTHLSSPSNLLPGACPIKFFCLSAYSRAIMEQWTS